MHDLHFSDGKSESSAKITGGENGLGCWSGSSSCGYSSRAHNFVKFFMSLCKDTKIHLQE